MEQPPAPTAAAAATSSGGDNGSIKAKKRASVPEEILAHYESQGLGAREAALEAVSDLQTLLYSSIAAGQGKKDRFMTDSLRKLDNANARLAILESRLDSKPDIGQSLAVGLASGALLRGADAALPHVLGGLRAVWDSVRAATRTSPSAS
ncbi:hypothetical protein Cni_G00779 [Canna indica]|uniref:Uncharacterized protein n=1 Tax=Canna indica TaxID=4628 RepID=A0AAQ3JLK4_9LILI|nr:hypothetical protein Cni_G00779 [Canna indica]